MGPPVCPARGVAAFAAPLPPPASASAVGRHPAIAVVTRGSLRAAAAAAAPSPRRRLSRHHGIGAAPPPAPPPPTPMVLPPIAGMGNSFGRLFRISTWGESHGGGVGVTIDGVPPHLPLTVRDIQAELARRRPGQSRIVTPRNEADEAEILSGVVDGLTVGTPVAVLVRNKDHRSGDYDTNAVAYRPSHADATYDAKYGTRAVAGGGRSSARETIGRVAGGAVAKKILSAYAGVEIVGYVQRVLDVELTDVDHETVSTADVEANMIRCPDAATAERMIGLVDEIRRTGNSVGGVVEVVARHVPAGLGSPVFDKLEADLAKACMSLPASKGFEVGSGFEGTRLTGFEHNDPFRLDAAGRTRTATNRSGGIQGGIANGETIVLRVAFKPTSTIGRVQQTVTRGGVETELRGKGRHDPCVLPRAVPMVEAMVALVLADALMAQVAQCELLPRPAGGAGAPNPLGPAAVPGTVLAAKQAAERAAKAAAAAAAVAGTGEENAPAAAAPELTS